MKKEKIQIVIIGLLCLLIAASICVQYRSVHNYTTEGQAVVQSMAENKLRDRVLSEQENFNKLQQELQTAQEQLENLRKNSSNSSDEAKSLESKLSETNRLLGYTDIKGKGLKITLEDADSNYLYTSDNLVHDLDLLEIVNELFNAGAEAISINDQRIISTTSITCNGNVVRINNEKVGVPFIIKAIGSPDGLYGSMVRPGGYLESMQNDHIKIKVEKIEDNNLEVPKYKGTIQYQFLQSVQ